MTSLVAAAKEARERAYAPYSRFLVGAAVLTASGEVFTGANVENASFGLTVCAERVAIFKAVAAGQRDFAAIAVVADAKEPAWPCGACRQVMAEFNPHMLVTVANLAGQAETESLAELLPRPFGGEETIRRPM